MKNSYFEATLAELEDRARSLRNERNNDSGVRELADIVTQLIQTVREDRHV
jgi:hypothetical protein